MLSGPCSENCDSHQPPSLCTSTINHLWRFIWSKRQNNKWRKVKGGEHKSEWVWSKWAIFMTPGEKKKRRNYKNRGRRKTVWGERRSRAALLPVQHVNSMPVRKQGSKNQGLAKQMRTNLRDFSRDRDQDKALRSRITHRTADDHWF